MEDLNQAEPSFSSEDHERHHFLNAAALEGLLGPVHIGDPASREAFQTIERRICGIFTTVVLCSTTAVLNRGDTCEVPAMQCPNRYLVFDEFTSAQRLLRISEALLDRLKSHGAYPYSDLDREPVL
jgi:hypothetical protein